MNSRNCSKDNRRSNKKHLSTSTYSLAHNIYDTKSHVPELLKVFVNEIVCSSVKQNLILQTSATRPRSLMSLQFTLAVATDNYTALK